MEHEPAILVVDDAQDICDLIEYSLKQAGYRHVDIASSGQEAVALCRECAPDLIVLDLMLPDMDGYEVCRTVRTFCSCPILFLSARGEEVDKLIGFALGADDYITKPFSPRELVCRYGKSKLFWAKTAVAFGFGIGVFVVQIALCLGVVAATYGLDGAQLPIQIASSVIPYDWTFARLALCAFGLATLVLCALIAFTLWLSVRVENPYGTLLVLAGCLFIPAFIAPTGATGLFNKVLFLTPYRALNMEIGKYVAYSMGKFVCDLATTRALVSLLALVLGVAGAKRAWRARE